MQILKSLREYLMADGSMTEKQINILISAIELFSEKGFEATTTSEIAKKAKVAEGTIFHYFKTKKELLLAVPSCLLKMPISKDFIDDINSTFENEHEKFEDFLRSIINNRKTFAIENTQILKVLFQEVAFHPELRDKILGNVLTPIIEKIIKIIDRFKVQGQIIDMPSIYILKIIATSVIGHFFTKYIVKIDVNLDDNDEIEYLIQYIKSGICMPSLNA